MGRNYHDQGGRRFNVGGEINILPGGKILANGGQAGAIEDIDLDRPTVKEVGAKVNQILAALRAVGIVAASTASEELSEIALKGPGLGDDGGALIAGAEAQASAESAATGAQSRDSAEGAPGEGEPEDAGG